MIRYLQNKDIDKGKWDLCIANSQLPVVYMLSWYLDLISPQWDALVSDNYETVMPLTWKKKFGIKYIYQSFLAQQSGIFTTDPKGINKKTINIFVRSIPVNFRYIDCALNETIKVDSVPASLELRKNHILLLDRDYSVIFHGYSRRCRRNIKRAQGCYLKNSYDTKADEAVDFFKKHLTDKLPEFSKYYSLIEQVILSCIMRNMGEVLTALTPDGEKAGVIFYLFNECRCTMIVCASTAEGFRCQTMYYLIDQIIQKFAGRLKELDFFGTNIPSIEYFNQSFGVETRYFARFRINHLPWLLRKIKR
jgi:hypothetical protein